MLTASLEGKSSWTHPITASLEGGSSWTRPEVVASLEGASSWTTTLITGLSGNSPWMTKEAADYRGTGGLYTRPAGASSGGRVKTMPKIVVKLSGSVVPVLRGRIRFTRSEPCDWSIEIDHNGIYDPTHAVATACRQKLPVWSIEITLDTETWKFTNLISDDYNVSDNDTVVVTGTDISERLNYKNHQPDLDCVSVLEGFADFADFGVTVVSTYDTKIDYYHRIGKPREWLDDWCGPLAEWLVKNGILFVYPKQYGKPARWGFIENEDLEVINYQATPWAIRNVANVTKDTGGQGVILDVDRSADSQFEGGFFGAQGPFQFPCPVRQVRAHVLKAERGIIDTFSYRGSNDNALSGLAAIQGQFNSNIPIAAVRFNYSAVDASIFTNGLFQPHFRVVFTGVCADRVQCLDGGAFGGPWEGIQPVTGGLLQPYETPFTYEHFTANVGQQLADNLAYEGALRGETLNWQTEIAPWIDPGFNVKMTERKRTKFENKTVFLESLEHTWDHTVDEESDQIVDAGTTSFDGRAIL